MSAERKYTQVHLELRFEGGGLGVRLLLDSLDQHYKTNMASLEQLVGRKVTSLVSGPIADPRLAEWKALVAESLTQLGFQQWLGEKDG